jgi:uncharacterized membrane protein
MKILILKLGLLIFSLLFIAGVWRNIPTATLIFRSFGVFLAIETLLVIVAVVFIKMTEKMRVEIDFEEEEKTVTEVKEEKVESEK